MQNEMKMRYPANVYPLDVIQRAIADYRHICLISYKISKAETVCCFRNSVTDLTRTVQEFSNYLIELINSGGGM